MLRAELSLAQKEEIADGLKKIQQHWHEQGWDFTLATCAEDLDLERFGIEHNRCIDGELMERLFSDDKVLTEYLHSFDKRESLKHLTLIYLLLLRETLQLLLLIKWLQSQILMLRE